MFAAGSEGSQLLGLAICHASGSGVELDAGSITLNGDYIGLDLTGAVAGNAGDGVLVSATSSGNHIGSNPDSRIRCRHQRDLRQRRQRHHLQGSSGNTLVDNRIGTDVTGTAAMANGGNGIWVTAGSNGNTIGGTASTDLSIGAQNDPDRRQGHDARRSSSRRRSATWCRATRRTAS